MALDLPFVLAFAFGAGMVAFFSPCCAAMLPAYVSFALSKSQAAGPPTERAADPVAARRRGEMAAILVWGGLFVAALGLGRLAVEAVGSFGAPVQALSPEDRAVSVGLASAGIAMTLLGYGASAHRRLVRRGLLFGALTTAGFLAVFILIGIPVALASSEMLAPLLYAAIIVGVLLVALGIATLMGIHISLPIRSFSPEAKGNAGFFLFGVAYALASLACTFPLFLVVVSLALVAGGFGAAIAAFAAYALGKGSIMILVTVLATASPAAVEGRLKQWLPKFDKAMAVVLIASGTFLVYYFALR